MQLTKVSKTSCRHQSHLQKTFEHKIRKDAKTMSKKNQLETQYRSVTLHQSMHDHSEQN